jgi:large subunit ribosomal protein L13
MKTFSAKPTDITRKWYLMDASEASLGRLSTNVATLLVGKRKTIFTPHMDCGDYVVVINSDKLVATGDKLSQKKYYRHSQYPGSLKTRTLSEVMAKDSTEVIRLAVRGMLPKNKLMDGRLERLKIYSGEEHSHAGQKPEKVSIT